MLRVNGLDFCEELANSSDSGTHGESGVSTLRITQLYNGEQMICF